MKSSHIDHLKSKLKPTFFGLFESQRESLLKNIYAYVNNKTLKRYPSISGCGISTSGGKYLVTLAMIRGEFDGYSRDVQEAVLTRVHQYVADYEAAKLFKPSSDQYERIIAVRDYFQSHIKHDQPSRLRSYSE